MLGMQHIDYEYSKPKNAHLHTNLKQTDRKHSKNKNMPVGHATQRIPGGRTSCIWIDGSKADGAKVKAEVPHRVDFDTLGAHHAFKITYMQEVVDEAAAEETNEHTQRKKINNKNE